MGGVADNPGQALTDPAFDHVEGGAEAVVRHRPQHRTDRTHDRGIHGQRVVPASTGAQRQLHRLTDRVHAQLQPLADREGRDRGVQPGDRRTGQVLTQRLQPRHRGQRRAEGRARHREHLGDLPREDQQLLQHDDLHVLDVDARLVAEARDVLRPGHQVRQLLAR